MIEGNLPLDGKNPWWMSRAEKVKTGITNPNLPERREQIDPEDREVLEYLGPRYTIEKKGKYKYLYKLEGKRKEQLWAGCDRYVVRDDGIHGETGIVDELVIGAAHIPSMEKINQNIGANIEKPNNPEPKKTKKEPEPVEEFSEIR
jgi:hypothetical protein